MKLLFSLLSLSFVCLSCQKNNSACQSSSNEKIQLNIMSYNIRFDNPDDEQNNWKYRKDNAAKAILFYDADIVGTQEVLLNQLNDFKERLSEYSAIGVGRADGKTAGEYSPILYKRNRLEEIKSGYFWLSETPEVVGSKGWDGACERIATWAIFKDKKTSKQFFMINTHLDHKGQVARQKGVELLLAKCRTLSNGLPVILTGDFNANPTSSVVKTITDQSKSYYLLDSRTSSPLVYGPNWTFNAFGKTPFGEREIIDYIFVSSDITSLKYGVLAEKNNENFLSDHCPIFSKIQF